MTIEELTELFIHAAECVAPECHRNVFARRMCTKHYQRAINEERRQSGHSCSIEGCESPIKAKGWCGSHYTRWRNYGSPTAGHAQNGDPLRFLEGVALAYDGDDCLTWPYSTDRSGYGEMYYEGKVRRVSRIVCERENGAPPRGKYESAHSCGNGHLGCVAKKHLRWATAKENAADKIEHGTYIWGEQCNFARLTEGQAREIKRLAITGMKQSAIAIEYGVHRSTVSRLVKGQRWPCLSEGL